MRKLLSPVVAATLAVGGLSVGCDKNKNDDMSGSTTSNRDTLNDSTYNRSTGRYDAGTAAGAAGSGSGAYDASTGAGAWPKTRMR